MLHMTICALLLYASLSLLIFLLLLTFINNFIIVVIINILIILFISSVTIDAVMAAVMDVLDLESVDIEKGGGFFGPNDESEEVSCDFGKVYSFCNDMSLFFCYSLGHEHMYLFDNIKFQAHFFTRYVYVITVARMR